MITFAVNTKTFGLELSLTTYKISNRRYNTIRLNLILVSVHYSWYTYKRNKHYKYD